MKRLLTKRVHQNDNYVATFATEIEQRPYTTREFFCRFGGHLWQETGLNGILTAAFLARVPIFCPATADSSIGMGLSQARHDNPKAGHIDVIAKITSHQILSSGSDAPPL